MPCSVYRKCLKTGSDVERLSFIWDGSTVELQHAVFERRISRLIPISIMIYFQSSKIKPVQGWRIKRYVEIIAIATLANEQEN